MQLDPKDQAARLADIDKLLAALEQFRADDEASSEAQYIALSRSAGHAARAYADRFEELNERPADFDSDVIGNAIYLLDSAVIHAFRDIGGSDLYAYQVRWIGDIPDDYCLRMMRVFVDQAPVFKATLDSSNTTIDTCLGLAGLSYALYAAAANSHAGDDTPTTQHLGDKAASLLALHQQHKLGGKTASTIHLPVQQGFSKAGNDARHAASRRLADEVAQKIHETIQSQGINQTRAIRSLEDWVLKRAKELNVHTRRNRYNQTAREWYLKWRRAKNLPIGKSTSPGKRRNSQ